MLVNVIERHKAEVAGCVIVGHDIDAINSDSSIDRSMSTHSQSLMLETGALSSCLTGAPLCIQIVKIFKLSKIRLFGWLET